MATAIKSTTAKLCKRMIEIAQAKGTLTDAYKEDMHSKMDLFVLCNRITADEYAELNSMLQGE